jgi:hypothetical protein
MEPNPMLVEAWRMEAEVAGLRFGRDGILEF